MMDDDTSMFLQAEALDRASADDVPLTRPFLNGREVELLSQVLESGVLGRGATLERFEHAFAQAADARVAVSAVTVPAAVRVLAEAAGWPQGAVVAVSAFLPRAAGEALQARGLELRVLDVDPVTLLPDAATVAAARAGGAVDVLVVDPIGVAPTVEANGATIVYDCERQLAIGPGAMLLTNDDDVAASWRRARGELGSAMGDLAAAVGMAQLEKLSRVLVLRQMVASEYARLLRKADGVATLPSDATGGRSWSTLPLLVDEAVDRDDVIARVRANSIACEPLELLDDVDDSHPVAARVARRGIAIPCFAQLSPQQQQRVVDAVRGALVPE